MDPKILAAVCSLPAEFRTRGNRSILALTRESGYLECRDAITEVAIEAHLRTRPELVREWVRYSADQRSMPSWYLLPPERHAEADPCWRVGYLMSKTPPELRFTDEFKACACFVKRMAEQWAESARKL